MRIPSGRLWPLLFLLGIFTVPPFLHAQTVTTFEGIDASELASPKVDVDPNGAVGTKQYLEWTNVACQAFDKGTLAPVWSCPQPVTQLWTLHNQKGCATITGDGYVLFDRLASRWVIAAHNSPGISGTYFYCVAISSTDDLTSGSLKWYTYSFKLNPWLSTNSSGNPLFPDWPKLGTWIDAYYLAFDLLDPNNHYQPVGAVACALDRANMLNNATARSMQCFSDPANPPTSSRYLRHSLIPADVEGTTPPPAGRDEYFVSIQNPTLSNSVTTSRAINLWDFHMDWNTPSNSTFTNNTVIVPTYTPGCYSVSNPGNTFCVPEPILNTNGTHHRIDSVGDRLMPRLSYRNFGTRESFVFAQTIRTGVATTNQQTGIRWYELEGSGLPALNKSGTIKIDTSTFRFMPSMAQDKVGNVAVGYNLSSATIHPSLAASWWNLPGATQAAEFSVFPGTGDEGNANNYGDYNSLTVDPVDGCTFWFVAEYFASNQTGNLINWNTRIASFKLPGCN